MEDTSKQTHEMKYHLGLPTDPFTILVLQNPSNNILELH